MKGLFDKSVKPTKHATLICTIVTLIALLGIIIGLVYGNTLVIVILLIPAAVYEAYRTAGESTKASSLLLLVVLIAQIFLLLFNINFNLAQYLGTTQQTIGGYLVPLGELTVVAPTLIAVLSVILFVKTRGRYTRWLAVTIFITSFAIIYSIDSNIFQDLLQYAVQEGMRKI